MNFPDSPINGQVYQYENSEWVWRSDPGVWAKIGFAAPNLVSSNPELITEIFPTAQNNDFTKSGGELNDKYIMYDMIINCIVPVTDGTDFRFRIGQGETVDSGNYVWSSYTTSGNNTRTYAQLGTNAGNLGREGISGSIRIYDPHSNDYTGIELRGSRSNTSSNQSFTHQFSIRKTKYDADIFRFYANNSAGIASGSILLYGWLK